MALSLTHHIGSAGRVELVCSGDIDVQTVATLRHELRRLAAGSARQVTVDLRNVDALDGSGVAAVAAAAVALRHRGARLELIEPREATARRILDLSGLLPLLAA